MRSASTLWLSTLLLVLLLAAPAQSKEVRVFAVEPKLDIAWMESRETYRAKMSGLFEREVAPNLRPDGANLVAWPEDIGLFAALTGERAAPARASGSLEGSIISLTSILAGQNAYYTGRFPELGQRALPVRTTLVSLTDVFGRVALETFAKLADRHDVWLHAGVNMVQTWQVVCRDASVQPPLGETCDEVAPQKVDMLGDPFEPGRGYVYEATTPDVSNMALVFDPAGQLVAKEVKAYITPTELPGQLDLVPADVSGLNAVETPVGTLGFVTSKDAWMPDVVQKLDQRGVELLVQPEFFVGNLVMLEGQWNPDLLLASGYSALVRHPSIETLLLPQLVGNIFNFSADHQSHIAVEPRRGVGRGFMVGQPPVRGLVDVMPWVVPDPARRREPFRERRIRLGEAGEKLVPGSGVPCPDPSRPGPCENGHVEGVLFRDIEVDRAPRRRRHRGSRRDTRFSRSRPLAPAGAVQRNASVSLLGRRGAAVWEELGSQGSRVMVARTRDHGRSWSEPEPVAATPPGTDQWWPAVAVGGGGRVTVAWVERTPGAGRTEALAAGDSARVVFARSTNGGRSFAVPAALDPQGANQWKPSLSQGVGDLVHAVFVDERERSADDDRPQAHVRYARIAGGVPSASVQLDEGQPAASAAKLDNSWAPSVSAEGRRVLVTWLDFLNYDWDVFARESRDGGQSFTPQRAVNDTPEEDEAINDSPAAAIGRNPWVAWTDWRVRDSSARRPHQQYDTYLARPGGENRQVDPHAERPRSTFSPSICADDRDRVLVAFQDASRGRNDVRVRRGARGRTFAVDDANAGSAWRPKLGCWRKRVVVLWEDERDGPGQIYFATSKLTRLR